MTSIAGIEFVAPPRRLSLADVLAVLDPADAAQASRLGVAELHVADGLAGHVLAARAARAALARGGVPPEDVDVLVTVPDRVPTAFMQSETTRLQAAIGAGNALAVSVGDLGCASGTSALLVLDALLAREPSRGVGLIAFAATAPTPYRYRRPVALNGDGATAVLVKPGGPGLMLLDVVQATDGDYWDLFSVEYRKSPPELWREVCRDEKQYSHTLGMKSIGMVRKLAADLLDRNGVTMRQVTHVVMQNLSTSSIEFYGQALDHPVSPVCAANLSAYGHLGPLDVFVNLRSLDGLCEVGDLVLALNNSPVAAWSVALFKKV
ncbi:MAG: hypothetical protein AUG49_11775 [Catenulispora sp. 13_1_20CM_3_70_7]|uniref:hypothetical protein n=1 Tax=Streptomyces sp. TaxID=1931 RepID=UPI000960D545|nr:hypothetical protein [Streptomyces sp.]MBW8799875.1 hypothetical protein [Streptomyces sp.]OLE25060.1 MAG: hypothetical protein AUG49_11775 [Catenulispora sp. 13_1_20CM_3_70_7]